MRAGPTKLDKNLLGQPTTSGQIDDPLSFWAQWFLNRQVSSVFTPSLTVAAEGDAWEAMGI
jgi:hypothetical protein